MKRNRNGFTLAELLIVVAIIGVLVAVSIPIFTSQLEKSRKAVDLANMRNAKAAAVAQYYSDGMPEQALYYYDASKGIAVSSPSGITGYGKSSSAIEGANGIPNPGGSTPRVVNVQITEGGSLIRLNWGATADRSITSMSEIGENGVNDAARVAQDTTLLNALQESIQGMTAGELKSMIEGNTNSKDFVLAMTNSRVVGQQTSLNVNTLQKQYINAGFTDLFASIGVDADKVNAKEEVLITTAGSGNDVRIKVNVGNRDLSQLSDDTVLTNAYVYLDAQDAQDKKYSSLYTAERSKTK